MKSKDPDYFYFKHFKLRNKTSGFKINTDGVLLGAWIDLKEKETVLDIGTGTGVIPLMLSQKFSSVSITAVEIQEDSYQEALFNFILNDKAIALHLTDIKEFARSHLKFDHIVCNPPYFHDDAIPKVKALRVSKHNETLDFDSFWDAVNQLSHSDTKVSVIIPFSASDKFLLLAKARSFFPSRRCNIKSRPHLPFIRVLIEFSRDPNVVSVAEEMHLQNEGRNNWSEKYRELTGVFYLDA